MINLVLPKQKNTTFRLGAAGNFENNIHEYWTFCGTIGPVHYINKQHEDVQAFNWYGYDGVTTYYNDINEIEGWN